MEEGGCWGVGGHGMDFAGWFGEWAWAEGGFVVEMI